MKCQTTIRGQRCTGEAAYIVTGLLVSEHPTCERCARMWKAHSTSVMPVAVTPIKAADAEKEPT